MSDNPRQRKVIKPERGFVGDLFYYIKLIVRLMADERVNPLLKLIPLGSLIYLLFPLDVPGPIDDAAVMGVSFYLFVELCPPEVVEEHRRLIDSTVDGSFASKPAPSGKPDDSEVIDGEFREDS